MTEEIQKIKEIALPIFQAAGFDYVGIFGSVARNESTPESDIDFMYDHDSSLKISLFGLAGLKNKLEDSLGRPVDLVQRDCVKPLVLPYIQKDLIVLYEKR